MNYYSIVVYLSLGAELTPTDMITHSFVYTILNSVPATLVQTLFITICYTLYPSNHPVVATWCARPIFGSSPSTPSGS